MADTAGFGNRQNAVDYINQWWNVAGRDQTLSPFLGQMGIGSGDFSYTQPDPSSGSMGGWSLNQAAADKLRGYTVDSLGNTDTQRSLGWYDASGKQVGGTSQKLDPDTGFDKFMYNGGALALPLLGGMALGSMGIGGAAGGAASSAASGAASGAAGTLGAEALPFVADYSAAAALPEITAASIAPAGASAGVAAGGLGGLLTKAPGVIGEAAGWLKANPTLGKAIFAAGTGLLSASGGSGGGSPSYGPPVQWSSPIKSGLLQQTAQQSPAQLVPQLSTTGNAKSGAWRFLGGN